MDMVTNLQEGEFVPRAIIDAVPLGMMISDLSRGELVVNQAWAAMLGYTSSELKNLGIEAITHREDRDKDAELFASLLGGQRTFHEMERRFIHKSGDTVWTKLAVSIVPPERGGAPHVLAVVQDLQKARSAQNALLASESHFRQMLDQMPIVFWAMSPDFRTIRYLSSAFEPIYGYSKQEMVNNPSLWLTVMEPDDRKRVERAIGLAARGPTKHTYRIRRPNGEVRWIRDVAFPIRNINGELDLIAGFGEDISEEKWEEERLRSVEERLRHAHKLETLGLLAGGIAHDFNNLLMGIMGYCELARARIGDGEQVARFLDRCLVSSRRAAELCGQMLAYSGKGSLARDRVDLSNIVRETSRMIQSAVPSGARLKFDLSPDLPCAWADAAQIRQVVLNLILNATESLRPTGGQVSISTSLSNCDGERFRECFLDADHQKRPLLTLEVSDDGCGMSEELQRRIFDPFFTTKQPGRGLGLAAVIGILRSHHGGLTLESSPDKGTTMRVLLPSMDGKPNPKVTVIQPPWKGGGTVLVVDDEPAVLDVAQAMLRLLGFSVLAATNGAAAVAAVRSHLGELACIVLDLTMPGMDGVETAEAILALDPGARIILASGYCVEEVERRGANRRIVGALQKPYDLAALEKAVRLAVGSVG